MYKVILFLTLFVVSINAQWMKTNSPKDRVFDFQEAGNYIYAGSENSGLFRSGDLGKSFVNFSTGLPISSYDIWDLEYRDGILWAALYGAAVIKSTDDGNSWVTFDTGFETQAMVLAVHVLGDTVYAAINYDVGLMPAGIYKSDVSNPAWTRTSGYFPPNLNIGAFMMAEDGTMYVGAAVAGSKGSLYVSTNFGNEWLRKDISGIQGILSFTEYENVVYAGAIGGIFSSPDKGNTWIPFGEFTPGLVFDDLLAVDGRIYAAVDPWGVAYSQLSHPKWIVVSDNLPNENDYVSSIYILEGKLYAALSAENGIWVNNSILSGFDDPESPSLFRLKQNYPNPFNPSTKIGYSIPTNSFVTLEIYNIQGEKVRELISRMQPAGEYSAEFNGEHLASGVYFARINAMPESGGEDFNKIIKMVLVK